MCTNWKVKTPEIHQKDFQLSLWEVFVRLTRGFIDEHPSQVPCLFLPEASALIQLLFSSTKATALFK